MVFFSYSAAFSVMAIMTAAVYEFKEFMSLLTNLICLLVCIIVFAFVTKINIRIERFLLAIIILSFSNYVIFSFQGKGGRFAIYNSLFATAYTTHLIHRLGLATSGNRLDITNSDYLYGGLINFMDVPYYLIGFLNYFIPIARWTGLNEEYQVPNTLNEDAQDPEPTPANNNTEYTKTARQLKKEQKHADKKAEKKAEKKDR